MVLTDFIYLGSNFIFLLLPIAFFALKKYSVFLHTHLTQPIEEDIYFQRNNVRFHIIYKIILIGGISISILYMISVLFINLKILNIHQLTQVDFVYFIFTFSQILFSIILVYLIISLLLYYRFKANERHAFIQNQSVLISVTVLLGVFMNLILYYLLVGSLSLPILNFSSLEKVSVGDNEFSLLTVALLLIIVKLQ